MENKRLFYTGKTMEIMKAGLNLKRLLAWTRPLESGIIGGDELCSSNVQKRI
jgi:hypothetical protein